MMVKKGQHIANISQSQWPRVTEVISLSKGHVTGYSFIDSQGQRLSSSGREVGHSRGHSMTYYDEQWKAFVHHYSLCAAISRFMIVETPFPDGPNRTCIAIFLVVATRQVRMRTRRKRYFVVEWAKLSLLYAPGGDEDRWKAVVYWLSKGVLVEVRVLDNSETFRLRWLQTWEN